ncbi:MAG: ribonuclease HI [Hyphococcus sp.]
MIEVFTDGACSGNPGPGGWGVLIIEDGERREHYGGEPETTNNRMEMQAAIEALKATGDAHIILYTDSQYLKNGINQWIHGWKRNGWKTASRKPVKNKDLWMELDALREGREIDWRWVKGHDGHPGNERADELARMGAASSAR